MRAAKRAAEKVRQKAVQKGMLKVFYRLDVAEDLIAAEYQGLLEAAEQACLLDTTKVLMARYVLTGQRCN